jgi:hypothetical protein
MTDILVLKRKRKDENYELDMASKKGLLLKNGGLLFWIRR